MNDEVKIEKIEEEKSKDFNKSKIDFTFPFGINFQMIRILEREGSTGIVLFGTIKDKDMDRPVLIMHEGITNRDQFVQEFFALLQRHGVTVNE